jgi:hypothetical protein
MADKIGVIFEGKDNVSNVIKQIEGNASRAGGNINKSLNVMGSFKQQFSMASIGPQMAAIFAAQKVIQFGAAIVETTAQFEKFKAMLKVAYGSQEEGNKQFERIKEFAKSTPYELDNVTESWIRLKNGGINPNLEMMTRFGDIASSQGKDMKQWIEAVLDSLTGENERLKEFGIKAEKNGDKVKFSFRGITTEVDNTNQAIFDYLQQLGDVEGIHGAMDEQMLTLGGKISNFKDSWTQLKATLGDAFLPVITKVTDKLTFMVGILTGFVNILKGAGSDPSILTSMARLLNPDNKMLDLNKGVHSTTDAEHAAYAKLAYNNTQNLPEDVKNRLNIDIINERNAAIKDGYVEYFKQAKNAEEKMTQFSYMKDFISNSYSEGKIDKSVFINRLKQLSDAFNYIEKEEDFKFTDNGSGAKFTDNGSGAAGDTTTKLKDPSLNLAENRSLKNIYINIDKQVETLNVYSEGVAESEDEIVATIKNIFKQVAYNIN